MFDAIQEPFGRIVSAGTAAELRAISREEWNNASAGNGGLRERLLDDAGELGRAVNALVGELGQPTSVKGFVSSLDRGVSLTVQLICDPAARSLPPPNKALCLALLAWLAVRSIGGPPEVSERNRRCRQRMADWGLGDMVAAAFRHIGRSEAAAGRCTEAVAAIQELPMWSPNRHTADASAVIASWLDDDGALRALQVHRRRDKVERFDSQAYAEFAVWMTWVAAVRLAEYQQAYDRPDEPMLQWVAALSRDLLRAGSTAGDRVDWLLERPSGLSEAEPPA